MLVAGSDAHFDPTDRLADYPNVQRFFDIRGQHVLVGDWFNILPWGPSKWSSRTPIVDDIKMVLRPGDVIVEGNHDPQKYMVPLFAGVDIPVLSYYEKDDWLFIHGYQRSDWAVWKLFAPGLVEWMVAHEPMLWYRICRAFGWLPSTAKLKFGGESQKYTMITRTIQTAWEAYGEARGINVVIGHTHKWKVSTTIAGMKEIWFGDCGDVKTDGTFHVVSGNSFVIEQ
jgi:hypothetical protein